MSMFWNKKEQLHPTAYSCFRRAADLHSGDRLEGDWTVQTTDFERDLIRLVMAGHGRENWLTYLRPDDLVRCLTVLAILG